MGLFKRLNDMINASINDLIDRVEDPEAMIKQMIREMEENVAEAKDRVIAALTHEKQLKQQLEQEHASAATWLQKAKTALENENEILAREALARKQEHDRLANMLEPNWAMTRDSCNQLKAQLRALELKLREAQLKRHQLIARQNAAAARQQMHDPEQKNQAELLDQRLEKMQDEVFEVEARAAAMEELEQTFNPLEERMASLHTNHAIEDDLASLRNAIKKNSDQPS